jgi:hypothetical protein
MFVSDNNIIANRFNSLIPHTRIGTKKNDDWYNGNNFKYKCISLSINERKKILDKRWVQNYVTMKK